jgi:prophage antirepressor-like protein
MSQEILVFSFESNKIRTLTIEGEVFFRAGDVGAIIGLRGSDLVRNLDSDEVCKVHAIDSLDREKEVSYLTEAGLYTVLLRSNKKEAKPFRKWVTGEVLPSIRKQGIYITEKLKEELAQKDQLIETLRANVHTLPAPRKCSKGSHMLVPQEQPCFEIDGHQPQVKLVPVPLENLSFEQRREAEVKHAISIIKGITRRVISKIGLRATMTAFYDEVILAIPE